MTKIVGVGQIKKDFRTRDLEYMAQHNAKRTYGTFMLAVRRSARVETNGVATSMTVGGVKVNINPYTGRARTTDRTLPSARAVRRRARSMANAARLQRVVGHMVSATGERVEGSSMAGGIADWVKTSAVKEDQDHVDLSDTSGAGESDSGDEADTIDSGDEAGAP